MTELHKPLKASDNAKQGKGKAKGIALTLIALGLVAVIGYFFLNRTGEDPVRVAVNQEGSSQSLTPSVKEPSQSKPSKLEVPETATQPGKLSPLLPLPDETNNNADVAVAAQPDFQPKKGVVKKLPPGIPLPDLIERTEFGPLPKVSNAGLRPLDAYSQAPETIGRTRIAIVIGGMGLSQTGTKDAIEVLPSSITLGFSPIGNSLQRWGQAARKQGHELVLQLPMEPTGYPAINPGRFTLVSGSGSSANIENLRKTLGRMSNYPVVMNYLGAGLLGNENVLEPLLAEVKARGLGWLDDGSVPNSQSLEMSKRLRLPHANGNFTLDGQQTPNHIRAQLKGLEIYANRRGFAIATGSAFPQTVKEVSKWAETANKRGIQIVPLSNLIKDYSR